MAEISVTNITAFSEAINILKSSPENSSFDVHLKIKQLQQKIQNSINGKTSIHLSDISGIPVEGTSQAAPWEPVPCYLLYVSPEPFDSCVMNAMASPPKFKQRGAIERSDGMGLERISVEKRNKSAS